MDFKLKFISLLLSYCFFIIVIIASVNAVIPEDEIPVFKPEEEVVKKINNTFTRNKNSVYDILENTTVDENQLNKSFNKNKDNLNKMGSKVSKDKTLRLQFASFQAKQKSIQISEELKQKFIKDSIKVNLMVKKVVVKNNQTFFRVISENSYSLKDAKSICRKLENIKIRCIIIKEKL